MKKIALVGIYYPVAILRYFENALKRRDDIELVTAGVYTGAWIPWNGGMNLLPKYAKSPDIPLPANMAGAGSFNVKALAAQDDRLKDVDLWIMVDAGLCLSEHPGYGIVAEVQTDPHVLQPHYQIARRFADHVFCMQTPYLQPGDHYLPYAYDPGVHYPIEVKEKAYDVTMIGLHYPQRNEIIDRLQRAGKTIYYNLGDAYDEYRTIYNRTRVGFNWSSKDDLVARVWELAAMKVPMVVNDVPDLRKFFTPDLDLLVAPDLMRATDYILTLCNDKNMRENLAENAYYVVTEGNHTYDSRVEQILETCFGNN